MPELTRRRILQALGAGVAAAGLYPWSADGAERPELITKEIPSSGESIPVIGMGTWQTFNVGDDRALRDDRTQVLRTFFELGGQVIDSSPMYGSSQDVVGYALDQLGVPEHFSADKVWTRDGDATREQVEESREKWRIETFDLMQVHNLVAWEHHLPTLKEMKANEQLRYVGITTSHGRRHGEFATVMNNRDLDFVQLTYNLDVREAERELLPLADERDIAVICNRPFGGGSLVDHYKNGDYPLPDWAGDYDISNWPQFLLKFIVSHPAVTCAIPATTRVDHMRENMGAARGELPDAEGRERMINYVENL